MSRRWPVPPHRLLDGRRVGAVSSAAATYGRPTLHYAMDVLTYVSTYVVRTYVRTHVRGFPLHPHPIPFILLHTPIDLNHWPSAPRLHPRLPPRRRLARLAICTALPP